MNENEKDFEALRRLLAWKRHETPPPGFYEHFQGDVMARLRLGESRGADRFAEELPWLFRLLSAFEAKPAFAGAFASALCLLLLGGIVYAERPDAMPQALLPATSPQVAVVTPAAPSPQASEQMQPAAQPFFASASSTNPVFATSASPSLFDSPVGRAQLVSFPLSGN